MTSANLLSLPTLAATSAVVSKLRERRPRACVSSRDGRYHDPADARSCHFTACSELCHTLSRSDLLH